MDDNVFVWTALPPLSLRGLGSQLVESIDFYLLRLSWTTGFPLSQIMGLLAKVNGKGGPGQQLRCYRTDANTEALILCLERLTGVSHLRYGTFWLIKNVIGQKASVGWGGPVRRWCPLCYKRWDPEKDWEPLVWSVPYVHRCPRHGCSLISHCPSCSATQSRSTPLQLRRICRSCKAILGDDGTFAEQPKLFDWVEKQVLSLVRFCATPGQEALSSDVLSELIYELRSRAGEPLEVHKIAISIGWLYSKSKLRPPTLRALINLSAFHGVPIVDLLTRPKEATGKPLLDLWSGFHWISDPFAENDDPVKRVRWMAKRLLSRKSSLYLPPIRVLAKDANVTLVRLKEFDPEIYASYNKAHMCQAGPSVRYARGKAFSAARKRLEGIDLMLYEHSFFWWLPSEVEKEVDVCQSDAFKASYTAMIYSRLLAMALNHSERLYAAKNDIRWIESAPPCVMS